MLACIYNVRFLFGSFKRSLNQSIGSLSCNPYFTLFLPDQRSGKCRNASNHWGMVKYNFFRNIFSGSLIRAQSGAEFVMHHTHFCILWDVDLLWGSRSHHQMFPLGPNLIFWANFFRSLIRAQSGAEFVMHHEHFHILWAVDLLGGSRSHHQMLLFCYN